MADFFHEIFTPPIGMKKRKKVQITDITAIALFLRHPGKAGSFQISIYDQNLLFPAKLLCNLPHEADYRQGSANTSFIGVKGNNRHIRKQPVRHGRLSSATQINISEQRRDHIFLRNGIRFTGVYDLQALIRHRKKNRLRLSVIQPFKKPLPEIISPFFRAHSYFNGIAVCLNTDPLLRPVHSVQL